MRGLGTGSWYVEADAVCYPELGKILAGDATTATQAVRWMDEESRTVICSRVIEALVEHREATNGPRPALDRLDSLMLRGPRGTLTYSANLVLARLFAESGDTTRALAAAKRRYVYSGNGQTTFLPSYLALEGELSLAVGDTTRARHAFEHYLRLRTDPDPPLQPQKARVEERLAALNGRQ